MQIDLRNAIEQEASARQLPVELIKAITMVESGGVCTAWRPEPEYRYFVDASTREPFRTLSRMERESETPPDDFPSCPGVADSRCAEWWGQAASWGPMQVMGAVAREHGFIGHFPGLCVPATGVHYGALHLASQKRRFFDRFGWPGVVAAYNAGSPIKTGDKFNNQGYVDKVERALGFRLCRLPV